MSGRIIPTAGRGTATDNAAAAAAAPPAGGWAEAAGGPRAGSRRPARGPVTSACGRAVAEFLEGRTLLSAVTVAPAVAGSGSIRGTIYNDLDADGTRDAGEPALAGWTVYLDQNRNGVRDAGETFTTSAANGSYSFTGLGTDRYYVAEEVQPTWRQTSPGGGGKVAATAATAPFQSLLGPALKLTTTGSTAPVKKASEPVVSGGRATPSDIESNALINLTQFRGDTRFAGVDGTGFSVAILDTGIDVNHPAFGPDLDGNGVADRIVYQHNYTTDGTPDDASDVDGHGSNVASIAAGQATGYLGMAPGANIIALKVLGDDGGGDFAWLEQALQWLVANAARYNLAAINMSLGDDTNYDHAVSDYGCGDELAALAAMNVITVSAAGNSYAKYQKPGVGYPAADANSLAVGAVYDADVGSLLYVSGAQDLTTGPDRVTSFSQRGPLVDIFAPGASILGAGPTGGTLAESGTSQASPHIAGIAVLAQELAVQTLGRRLTVNEFRGLLQSSALTLFDGDDEDDNVDNTNAPFQRVDVEALGQAILDLGAPIPTAFEVGIRLTGGQAYAGADFGNVKTDTVVVRPGRPDLTDTSDTGVSYTDDLTKLNNADADHALKFTVPNTNAGDTITLYADGTLIGTKVAIGTSTVVTTDGTTVLPDGTHVITARSQEPGYALSVDSLAMTVTVYTVTPAAPTLFRLNPASDGGVSNSDLLYNTLFPKFDVAVPGPYFHVRDADGNLLTLEYATGTSATLGVVQDDGKYTYTAFTVDAAGNESAGLDAPEVEVDRTPWNPTVDDDMDPMTPEVPLPIPPLALDPASDLGVAPDDNITSDTTPTFNVSPGPPPGPPSDPPATPSPDLPDGSYYRVLRNGVLASDPFIPKGVAFTSAPLAAGTYNFVLVPVDAAGNQSRRSAPVTVTIDTTGVVGTVTAVAPDPRGEAVDKITIRFPERVFGFGVDDLVLSLDGGPNLLTPAQTLTASGGGRTYELADLTDLTAAPGTYKLSLAANATVTDASGNAATFAPETWVVAGPPVANAGGPYTVVEGGSVLLSAAGSTGGGLKYQWDLDYDGTTFAPDVTTASPEFSALGLDGPTTRTVALAVTDFAERTSPVVTATVTVANAAPTASFSTGPAVALGTPTTVALSGVADPSAADAAAGFTYSFDFNNDGDFADAGDVSGSASPTAAFVYTAAGNYTVRGRVTDKDGGFTDYTVAATVNPPATGGTTVVARSPADATVRDGTFANTNYGTAATLEVRKNATAGNTRDSYLRFDLASVGSAAQITSAVVRLFGKLSATGGTVPVALYSVASNTWTETGIKYANKPAAGTTALASKTVTSTTGAYLEFDVTAYLKAQKAAGASAVSFALRATAASTPVAVFNSDEAAANKPELKVVQQPASTPQAIVLSASTLTVPEGKQASVTVRLAAKPAASVTVVVARTAGDASLSATVGTLTFTPANWNVAQTLSVLAAQDADATNGSATFTFSSSGLAGKTLTVTEADDDVVTTKTLRPTGDAYVRDGTSAGLNFGSAADLQVRQSSTSGQTRWTLLKFDLSTVTSVSSATLKLFGKLDSTANASIQLQAFAAANATWTEAGVTWNNRPAASGSAVGGVTVAGTTAKGYTLDLTAFLKAQKAAGKTTVAIVLSGSASTTAGAVFNSDEAAANGPQLVVVS